MDLDPNPFTQFRLWYEEARASRGEEASFFTVATTARDGAPSARMIVLRGLDERGFVFYTSSYGQKSRELQENPRSALVFYWPVQNRQVRIVGPTRLVSREESDAYFRTRPRDAQLAAWAAPQSEVIASRGVLDEQVRALEEQYPDEVPVPPDWIGYRVEPASFEFWQSHPSRLHDRMRYTRQADGTWRRERLAP